MLHLADSLRNAPRCLVFIWDILPLAEPADSIYCSVFLCYLVVMNVCNVYVLQ